MVFALIFYFISSSTSNRSKLPVVLDLYNQDAAFLNYNTRKICFCKAERTYVINVFNSSMTVLPSRLLKSCEKLNELNLSNNKIMEIKNDTFENLTYLYGLDLSFNQLITLPKNVFKPLVSLLSLNLQGNKIQIIDPYLFFHNEYLSTLDISNNSLIIILPKTFRNNLHLAFLNVSDNRNLSNIDLFPEDREKILSLNLSNCAFTQLYIPKNVEEINAQSNQINSITAHPKRILRHLDVRNNNLTNFVCLPPDNLRYLRIEKNGIGFVDFHDISYEMNLSWLSMGQNPKQHVNAAKMNTICPLLLNIDSPGKQTPLLYDFKHHGMYIVNNDGTIEQYSDIFDGDEECKIVT